MIQIDVTPTTIAVILSGAITLATVAAAWGNLRAQIKSLYKFHETTDNKLTRHGDRLDGQGQRIAHLEGVLPHGADN